jgi:hypothetical protein
MNRLKSCALFILAFALLLLAAWGQAITEAAWKRPIGQPLENAGTRKPALGHGHGWRAVQFKFGGNRNGAQHV